MIDPLDLHAFVDGELNSEQAETIRNSLAGSHDAAREVESIRHLKAILTSSTAPPAGQDAWQQCLRRLDEVDRVKERAKSKRIETIVARLAPGLCVVLLACILIVGRRTHHPDLGNLSGPDFAKMADGLSPMRPPRSPGMNFERWQKSRIQESFKSTPDHLTTRGVRAGEIDGVPVTEFSARDQYGDLKIYRISQPVGLEGATPMEGHPDLMVGNLGGSNCVMRREGGNTILIVADRTPDKLAEVAAQVRIR
jgi:hypothetical protein